MPGREGYVLSGGFKIHYAEWGTDGPNIVLMHSMGMDCHSMDRLCETLQKEYRVLALTNLGHGYSDIPLRPVMLPEHANILRSAVAKLGYVPYTLVGHSVGGMMGMIIAAEHPEELKGLVLVDIAPLDLPRPTRSVRPLPPDTLKDEAADRAFLNERYPGMTPYYVENRIKYSFVKEGGVFKPLPTGESVRVGMNVDLWPYVEKIRVPTLLLKGGDGSVVSPEAFERMKMTVPGIQVAQFTGTGHMIPQDKPEEFEAAVVGFLAKRR